MVAVVRALVGLEEKVAAAYLEGATTTVLAEQFDVSASTICRVLDRAGMPRRSRGQRVSGVRGREQEVAAAFLSGATVQELADRFGCSTKPINDALARAGVTRGVGPRRRRLAGHEHEISVRYKAGETLAELGGEHGVSPKVIAACSRSRASAQGRPGGPVGGDRSHCLRGRSAFASDLSGESASEPPRFERLLVRLGEVLAEVAVLDHLSDEEADEVHEVADRTCQLLGEIPGLLVVIRHRHTEQLMPMFVVPLSAAFFDHRGDDLARVHRRPVRVQIGEERVDGGEGVRCACSGSFPPFLRALLFTEYPVDALAADRHCCGAHYAEAADDEASQGETVHRQAFTSRPVARAQTSTSARAHAWQRPLEGVQAGAGKSG
jgi:transposase-like protein